MEIQGDFLRAPFQFVAKVRRQYMPHAWYFVIVFLNKAKQKQFIYIKYWASFFFVNQKS